MPSFRRAWLPALILAFSAAGPWACKGGGGSDRGPVAPDPSLGPSTSVTLCGTTTAQFDPPCKSTIGSPPRVNLPANMIELKFFTPILPCPCFTFTLLNLNQSDLGSGQTHNYGLTGLRAGTYQVSGQLRTESLTVMFRTDTTFSAIGVVPGSIKSLSGPASPSSNPCGAMYTTPRNLLPTSFGFEFTVASTAAGGTCTGNQ